MKLRVGDLTWREIDRELVILDLRSSTYHTTNASGAVLMQELTDNRTEAELAQCLVEAFGVSRHEAESGVKSFTEALGNAGLLEHAATS